MKARKTFSRFCPDCDHISYVKESRLYADGSYRRKRVCRKCGKVWWTMEVRIEKEDE